MLKIRPYIHISKSTTFGLIKHFYKHGKHTATTKFNEIETEFIYTGLALFVVDCMFSQRSSGPL